MSDMYVFSLSPWVKVDTVYDLGDLEEDYQCAQTASEMNAILGFPFHRCETEVREVTSWL